MIEPPAINRTARAEPRMSWPDSLVAAIDRLPVAAWIVYVTAAALAVAGIHLLLWAAGALPPGQFTLSYAVLASLSIMFLAAFDYLNHVAERSAAAFQPATDLSDQEIRLLAQRLTRMPSLAAWLSLPVAAAWAAAIFAADATFFGMATGQGPLDALLRLIGWVNTVFMVLGTIRCAWILAIVARSHEMITHLDLFAPRPLFAFSAFTVRIAIVVIGLAYIFFLAFPTVTANPVAYVYIIVVIAPLSLAEFGLPLIGIHEDMVWEKDRLEVDIRRRIDKVIDAIHRAMDADAALEFGNLQAQKELLGVLIMEEEYIRKARTWPWSPNTLRSLLIAVLLPLALFVAQKLLGRVLGL